MPSFDITDCPPTVGDIESDSSGVRCDFILPIERLRSLEGDGSDSFLVIFSSYVPLESENASVSQVLSCYSILIGEVEHVTKYEAGGEVNYCHHQVSILPDIDQIADRDCGVIDESVTWRVVQEQTRKEEGEQEQAGTLSDNFLSYVAHRFRFLSLSSRRDSLVEGETK